MHPREFDMWRYNISELYALIYPSVPFYTLNLSLKNNTIHTWMIYLRAFTTYLCWSEGRGWRDILVYGRGSPRPNFSTFLPYSCFWGENLILVYFGDFWNFIKNQNHLILIFCRFIDKYVLLRDFFHLILFGIHDKRDNCYMHTV